jgi:uncharacterized protein (TIGR00369 family)
VEWDNPGETAGGVFELSGLELLQEILAGRRPPPPAAKLLGYRISHLEPGRTLFEMEPDEFHYNPLGTVHGGILSLLLDTAMTSAGMSTLPRELLCSTMEMKVNFVRPVTKKTGLLRSEGKTVHEGKQIITAEARLTNSGGTLYAHGIGTLMIFSKNQKG